MRSKKRGKREKKVTIGFAFCWYLVGRAEIVG